MTVERIKRITVLDIQSRKGKTPVVCLTASSAPMAHLLDPHCDILLVGDSLGMVLYGYTSTRPVSCAMMMAHGKAVVGASHQALVVIDLPFSSYEESPSQAYRTSASMIAQTGSGAVKLEGGLAMAKTVSFLSSRHISVMGHIGLTPQSCPAKEGYRVFGSSPDEAARLMDDARALEDAGAFALVVECVREDVARNIVDAVGIPVIGIGASPHCDGQILVSEDMLGLSGTSASMPKFVRQYAQLDRTISDAVQRYAKDVRTRNFPDLRYCYDGKSKGNVIPSKRRQA